MIIFREELTPVELGIMYKIVYKKGAEAVMEYFLNTYVLTMAQRYADFLADKMKEAASGVMDKAAQRKVFMEISSAQTGFKTAYKNIYNQFINNIYGDSVLKDLGVESPLVIETIKKNTLKTFNNLTSTALAKTDTTIKNEIRKLQRDLIAAEKKLQKYKDLTPKLDQNVNAFRARLMENVWTKNAVYREMMDGKKFIVYSNGAKHGIEEYSEMSIRTTTLNIERDAVEMAEKLEGRRVSMYYLRDNRALKTGKPRPICAHVLSRKFFGASIVAHDTAAAQTLGCLTVEQVRAKGGMCPNCRHSISTLPPEIYNRIDKILFFAENEII